MTMDFIWRLFRDVLELALRQYGGVDANGEGNEELAARELNQVANLEMCLMSTSAAPSKNLGN